MALGLNGVAFQGGSLIGLILGGVLAAINWRLVFLVSVPMGIAGTIWAYLKLQETSIFNKTQGLDFARQHHFRRRPDHPAGRPDLRHHALRKFGHGVDESAGCKAAWWRGSSCWSPLSSLKCGSRTPCFASACSEIRMFAAGNVSGFLQAVARGGLMFMLIIWLQGIWLPLHGYNFEDTPLWAGIYMAPMMGGFFLMGPLSGWLSDRFGSRGFATGGMLITMVGFLLLAAQPANFSYVPFMLILVLLGLGMGMFESPNMQPS